MNSQTTIETNMSPIRVELKCNECNEGTMESYFGLIKTGVRPKQYLHECTHCDARIAIEDKKFPYIKHIPNTRQVTLMGEPKVKEITIEFPSTD